MSETTGRNMTSELRHEFRTPINQIVGYAEMLREDAVDDSADALLLDRILSAARDGLALINEALPSMGTVAPVSLEVLIGRLGAPQQVIVATVGALLDSPREPQFQSDAERIGQAALRLTTVPGSTAPARPSAPPTAAAASGVAGATRAGRILIVDDVEENRTVLARRLVREGYEVHSVASGAEALQQVAGGAFDLVLLDVLMPEMDGFAVLERIKGAEATRKLPVIMISALDDLSSVVRCIEHGAEDYLAKPFDPVLLRARIGASLEKKRSHDREADYLRQVTQVIAAAAAVEHGTYAPGALSAITGRGDELGRLARVFDAMAVGVKAREARLEKQLSELRTDVSLATSEHQAVLSPTAADGADAFTRGYLLADRYEILDVIGRGGMGVVYHARDRELNEEIAIKTIRRDLLSGDPVLAERFKSEIRLARRISHRNVVRTHDLGESDGTAFVTMEFVRGITVRELLVTRGKLGVASALAVCRQFASALAVAHAAGVIHRDVKPENALLDAEGVLKVMDFGIARLAEATTARTQSGMIVGTPAYMSPEQLVGEEIDHRSDLYALGVVLYECLTGQAPFVAPSMVALIGKVLATEPLPPSTIDADIPAAHSDLVMQLLAKSPDARPKSAAALLELLAELG